LPIFRLLEEKYGFNNSRFILLLEHVFLSAVDRFRLWRQHGLYLELANEGNCSETSRTHR
jgi:hypothetical protein